MKRTPIHSLTVVHGPQVIEESYPNEAMPSDVVYVDPQSGRAISVGLVRDIPPNVIEVPKTTWYR